jgi:glucosamine-6-phosphate deaminase
MSAGQLNVKTYQSRASLGKAAVIECAAKIKEIISQKGEVNIIFGAAPSQDEFINGLVTNSEIEWVKINAFHMDEYIGLSPESPQRLGYYLKARLFDQVNLKSVNYIDGAATDIEAECLRYTQLLEKYPADIVCAGIGENGHLAFNDPHIALFNDKKLVKVMELDQHSRIQQINDGNFQRIEDVPTKAITLTIPALLRGTHIFCMAPGIRKAEAVQRTITGEIGESCPATILKTHSSAILYTDFDSLSLVKTGL